MEAAELGRHHNFLLCYNSQVDHTTAKSGVAHLAPGRRLDCKADERPRCGMWSDCYRSAGCIAVAPSAEEIERDHTIVASRMAPQSEAGAGILPEALCRPRRDEWVYYVGWRAHSAHVPSHDCSVHHMCSGLLLLLLDFVPGRCQNRAHRHFHQSSELFGVGGQGRPGGNHKCHIGPAGTGMDGLRVDRRVGRWNSLTWSCCRLLTRVVTGLARWSVAFIERQTSAMLASSTAPRSHVRRIRLRTDRTGSKSSSAHSQSVMADVVRGWKRAAS